MLLPTPSQGSSQIARVEPEHLAVALRARTVLAAFEQPTVAMAVKSLGEQQVLIQMTAAITKAFVDYFAESQRMDPDLHASFAETIIEDFPNESPADVVLFIKYAARARYGEVKDDGSVVNKGKTFGRLSTTTAIEWFKQYLGEKADAIADQRRKENKRLNEHSDRNPDDKVTPIVHDTVLAVMKKAAAEARADEDLDTGRRVAQLVRTVRFMGVERLRLSWDRAKTKRERTVVLEEANRRGLVQKRIEDHLSKLDC